MGTIDAKSNLNKNVDENIDHDIVFRYWQTEYNGLISEHLNMWRIFSQSLRLYLGILAAPMIVVAIFLRDNGLDLKILPEAVRIITIVVGITGFIFSVTVIRYRLDVILYARWLNGLRAFLAGKSPKMKDFWDKARIPYDRDLPQFWEKPPRPMSFLVLFTGAANTYYMVMGFAGTAYCFDWIAIAALCVGVAIHYLIYWCCARGPQIAGQKNKAKTRRTKLR